MSGIDLHHVLFVDLECVPQYPSFYDLDDGLRALREKKAERLTHIDEQLSPSELYENRSGIYAEFWKIICISVWCFAKQDGDILQFRTKSFFGDDERELLLAFFELLDAHYNKPHHYLCGHNIREFDIPYICRRALVNELECPSILFDHGKKPWEVQHLDTMEMRKFGDKKTYTSLDLLTRVMWLPSPKVDISGEQVARVYRDDQDLPRITEYCERDVLAVAQLYLKFVRHPRRNEVIWGVTAA